MNRVVFSPRSSKDLNELAEYISDFNLDVAIQFCLAIESEVQRLAEFPGMGTRRHFPNARVEIRSWAIRGFLNCLILYMPIQGGIEVVRIVHGARNLESLFEGN